MILAIYRPRDETILLSDSARPENEPIVLTVADAQAIVDALAGALEVPAVAARLTAAAQVPA